MNALAALDTYLQGSGLEPGLVELVKTRALQINGCAYCLHLHTRDARAKGESEKRLYLPRSTPIASGRRWPRPWRDIDVANPRAG